MSGPRSSRHTRRASLSHVEIPVDDPNRAQRFYQGTFGWAFSKWDGPTDYWSTDLDDDRSITAGLVRRGSGSSGAIVPIFTVYVASIDDALRAATEGGGRVTVAKRPVRGVGWEAYLVDSEGNALAVFQVDPEAR